MKSISWRTQLWLVALGYAAVFVVSASLVFARYVLERLHHDEVVAAGGMYAGGDTILGIFIVCLFMIPTVFLIWVVAKFEAFYKIYSRFLLGLSITAPVSLVLFYLGENHVGQSINLFCLCRLLLSPFIFVGIGVSRLTARFDRAKRLVSYALLIEGLTLVIAVVLFIRWARPIGH